ANFYFNTINSAKIKEIEEIFSGFCPTIKFLKKDVLEVLSNDIKTVIKAKAKNAYEQCRVPIIVEHGGLLIDHLNGFPGALSKPMWDLMGKEICQLIPVGANRSAVAISGVCYCDGIQSQIFIGETKGSIANKAIGDFGFQWDPIFIPDGDTRTYAEMPQSEKLKYSQAAKAYRAMQAFFTEKRIVTMPLVS
ncbi:MAG: non-canonical purine NTP pyrophosphatase, partial [Sediminibacterium sp.]